MSVAGFAMSSVSVIIPALDEEEPIAGVVHECLATGLPSEVIVVDNGSTDRTAERAHEAGARVVTASRGYGRACAAGVRALSPECDMVVFLDGDGSDVPAFMNQLVDPVARGTHDFVIGSRTRGKRERGSMNFQQILAGRLAGLILRILYGVRYTDMSPFRAIRRHALEQLDMREQTYGWNLEMQMKAARDGLRVLEVPVNHRRRAGGESKVSGTFRGTFVAGSRIVTTLLRVAVG
ncbi:MAG TPA: glycosyltransferase family 2 protein [Candidatus Acidoferrum sp.]|nr:glycosyltransferase family 2 protein [Candidatus Acidoferrum sp.]